ncbi:C4-dicarboxylate ABC transporter [Azoarcus indigens]|uniref:TRAP-type C4-dicarboxylate transport system substrate-binding protein n=1 Tax=Azoarcus indigens TaxID=29545 RepID=A0A4R6DT12_9RHOO|nr:TRAP transporter substrate-binding protein [Azoarcus indigens]NMG67000.1 C4-dicarboxylate ABC transporter [Azoarcus indigens]TDN47398.1 TRAP-type C4-dicarboxylate transport system substrate-binding protein [Azoarcus indigens]
MPRKLATAFIATAALAATLAAPAARAQEVVLKVAHFWPATALSHQKVLLPWCDKIAKESNNRLKCQLYPAMQLGGTPPQLIQQAIDGVADIVWTLPGYTPGRFPSVEVFELPFMSRSAEATSRAVWDYVQIYGQKDFGQLKPLAFHVHDNGYIHGNKPIEKLADFRGMKMRAPTRLTNKMLAAFGATPVAMPLPQVTESMSKGVIDGYVLPWEVIPPVKLHELTRYHAETDPAEPALYTAVFTIAMNKARYEGLPPELKQVIDANSGAEFSAMLGRVWDESAAPARQKAVDHGNRFNTIPSAELANWRTATDKLAVDWVAEMKGKGYDGQAMLDSAKELIRKYDK